MTLATRQTFAASQSSSIVAFFSRKHSRSAWIASSVPVFDRNLKQSATVFAGLYTLISNPSTRCSTTPKVRASPETRITRMGGYSMRGDQAPGFRVIQTSKGFSVVRFVEAQRGRKADHGLGHLTADLQQRPVFG